MNVLFLVPAVLLAVLILPRVTAETIFLSNLTIEEKLGQLVIVRGLPSDAMQALRPGGIFLDGLQTREEYETAISVWQSHSPLRLLVATDMEGYWNPFPFYDSPSFGDIDTALAAEELGREHGTLLRDMGFTINFSPVVDRAAAFWPGRSFSGSVAERREKIAAYIRGVQQEGIMATAKHYPGGALARDPHRSFAHVTVSNEDLEFFSAAENASAIMVGHAIARGALSTNGKQASVSPEAVKNLRENFNGLIISDDVSMLGLRFSYFFNSGRMYVDVIKAGNDIVLDSGRRSTAARVARGIAALKRAVESGDISEKEIDEHLTRVLMAKGYIVA